MVHVRFNEKGANPNPHINFITPLTMGDPHAEEEARQLLRALAAQVRPLMKAEGFAVNSFEEYEHNHVFAGRNWNNGETVELVLRGAHGGFLPTPWLISTLCHELAHIKHMNHGPAFQALWAKLRADVRRLQSEGYYGDGFWSSGTCLSDFARMGSQGLDSGDLPEYMCGGAQSRARPASLKRRRRQTGGPSNRTGAQTAKKRKPGTRVRAKGVFVGTGRALNDDIEDSDQKRVGTGFRKQAGSKRAREERALAAERRLLALQGQNATAPATKTPSEDEGESEEDSDYEWVAETDQDRRRTMLESAEKSDLDGMKAWQRDYSSDFIFPPVTSGSGSPPPPDKPSFTQPSVHPHSRPKTRDKAKDLGVIELSSDEEDGAPQGCDMQSLPMGGTAAGSSSVPPSRKGKHKQLPSASHPRAQGGLGTWLRTSDGSAPASMAKQQKPSYGALVKEETTTGTKESCRMCSSGGRQLGGASSPAVQTSRKPAADIRSRSAPTPTTLAPSSAQMANIRPCWTCQVCTLLNEPEHLACSACTTPRGESTWAGSVE